jgi:hypothetical protein
MKKITLPNDSNVNDYLAKAAEIEKQIDARRTEVFELRTPLDEELSYLYDMRKTLNEQREKFVEKNKIIPSWDELLVGEGTRYYKLSTKELNKLGLDSMGYYPETNQRTIKFWLNKNDLTGSRTKFNQVINGIQTILPYMKPLTSDGILDRNDFPLSYHFDFMENTLHEYCLYRMIIEVETGLVRVISGRYDSWDTEYKGTLEGALEFIATNHSYD